jgi:hypothetical protein
MPFGSIIHFNHSEINRRRETWVATESKQKPIELLVCPNCGTTSRLVIIYKKWYENAVDKGFEHIQEMATKNNIPQVAAQPGPTKQDDFAVSSFKPQFIDI